MTYVKPYSFGRLMVAMTTLTIVAVPTTIPWQLVAQESSTAKSSDDHSQQAAAVVTSGDQVGEPVIR